MVYQKKYSCNQCEFKTIHQCSLNLHKRRHSNVKPFHCDVCNFKALHKNSLILHKMKHTNIKPYKCDMCDFKTIHKNSLGFHKNRHMRMELLFCDQCNYKTGFKTNFAHHKNIHLKEKQSGETTLNSDCSSEIKKDEDLTNAVESADDKPFLCDICDYKAASLFLLTSHKIKHSDEKRFYCDQCEYKSKRKIALRFHKMKHKINKLFKCDQCYFKTYYKHSITQHKKKHSKKKSFPCELSDDAAFHKQNYNLRNKNTTNEKSYENDLGDFTTPSKNNLGLHKMGDMNENQFYCDQCNFSANFKSNLILHKASHSNATTNSNPDNVIEIKKKILDNNQSNDKMVETNCLTTYDNQKWKKAFTADQFDYTKAKETNQALNHKLDQSNKIQFICDLCDLKFLNKNDLVLHENVHNVNDIFRCEMCDFRIFHKNSFILHLLKHDLFQCNVCGFITNFKNTLELHKSAHVKERFFCNHCDYETKSENNLIQHRLLHKNVKLLHFETSNNSFDPLTKPEEKALQFHLKSPTENYQPHKEHNKETFSCDRCDFKTLLENNLIQHKLIHMDRQTSCDAINCEKEDTGMSDPHKTTEGKSLPVDYKSAVDNWSPKIEVKASLNCNQCDFKTQLENDLIQHILIHINEKPFHDDIICETEEESMSNPLKKMEKNFFDYKLDDRSQRIQDNETFYCSQCDFRTQFKKKFVQHKLVHMDHETSNDVIICEREDKTEDYESTTVDIQSPRIEENEPFYCNQCDFKTQFENNLIQHKLIHLDEKQFHDDIICEMEVKSASNPLNMTEKNSLQCDYKLDNHSQKIDDNETFYCDQCDFMTRLKKKLIQHKLTHMNLETSHDDYTVEMKDKLTLIPLKIIEEKSLQFSYKSTVIDNHSQEIQDNEIFYCDRCDFKTQLKNNLTQHKLIHMDKKSSQDDINFETEDKDMSNPLKVSEGKSLEVNYKTAMVNNRPQEIEDETFFCSQCDFKTQLEKKFVQHKLYHLGLMPAPETVNNNDQNLLKQTTEKSSQLHFKSRIEENYETGHNKVFFCDQCNFKTHSEKKSIQHKIFHMEQKSSHAIYTEANLNSHDQIEVKCLPFHFKSATEGDLSHEIENSKEPCHSDQFVYTSQFQNNSPQHNVFLMDIQPTHYINFETMDKSLANFNSFKKPNEKVLNCWFEPSTESALSDKIECNKFSCDKCSFIGRDRTHLFNHKRKHSEAKPYACNQCEYKAKSKYGMGFHMMKHNNDKPFQCEFCDFKSVYKNSLYLHLRKHGAEKPFHCDLCDFKALHKNSLNLHKMKHTNIKPYTCDECDFSTIHKNSLGLHKRRHVRLVQYNNCDLCDFKTLKKNALILHQKNHNNEN